MSRAFARSTDRLPVQQSRLPRLPVPVPVPTHESGVAELSTETGQAGASARQTGSSTPSELEVAQDAAVRERSRLRSSSSRGSGEILREPTHGRGGRGRRLRGDDGRAVSASETLVNVAGAEEVRANRVMI